MESIWKAVVLGVVEGITEFLPVSSTGHLLIAENLLHYQQSDAFNILIQVGPIVAVTLVFWKYLFELFTGLGTAAKRDEFVKLTACFFATGAGGLVAKKLGLELPETILPIAIATIIGALAILLIERRAAKSTLNDVITWPIVFAVAAGQLLAGTFPGTSRSGAAIMAALILGLSRPVAVRFAFLVGIPTMFAAAGYQVKEVVDAGAASSLVTPATITAFVVATVTAWVSVVWLLKYVQTRTFIPFVWYRFALGAALLGMLFLGR